MMKSNVASLAKNYEDLERSLLPASQELKAVAHQFKNDAKEMEEVQASTNFWACSTKCVLLFGAIIIIAAGAGVGLYFGLKS